MSIQQLIKQNKVRIAIIIVYICVGAILIAAGNALLAPGGDALKNGKLLTFLSMELLSACLIISGGVIRYFSNYLYAKQQQEYIHTIRSKLVKSYWHETSSNIKISNIQNNLTNNLNIISENSLDPWLKIFSCGLDIVFSALVVFTYSWLLLILIIISAVILLQLPKLLSNPIKKATSKYSKSNDQYLDTIEKWFSGLQVLQRYKIKSVLQDVLKASGKKLEDSAVEREKKISNINGINYTGNIFAQSLVMLVTGILIAKGYVTFGVFFSIGNFASTIFTNLVVVANQLTLLHSSQGVDDDLKEQFKRDKLMTTKVTQNEKDEFEQIAITNLSIQISVTEKISYPNIIIHKGEKVLLSGDSGTGKSTLLKIILGDYKATTGKIIFKDKDGKDIDFDSSRIGYLPQDPILFPGTIRENITLFNPKLNDKAEYWASKFQLTSDLQKFPKGIDTKIDLDTNNLSGGQRQKVILARTKTYDKEIILVDEGTSSIDSMNTKIILKNLLNSDNTVIFIGHNFDKQTQNLFDRQIYLKNKIKLPSNNYCR